MSVVLTSAKHGFSGKMQFSAHVRFTVGFIVRGSPGAGPISNQDQRGTYLHHQENLACFTARPKPLSFTRFLCLSLPSSRSQSIIYVISVAQVVNGAESH